MNDLQKRNMLWAAAAKVVELKDGQNEIYCTSMEITKDGISGIFGGHRNLGDLRCRPDYEPDNTVKVTVHC